MAESAVDVDEFKKCKAQLESFETEIGILSRKSPNDPLNKFKLKFINQIISKANSILGEDYRPFADFNEFDEVSLPSNSDVVLMLAQYLKCMERLRLDDLSLQMSP